MIEPTRFTKAATSLEVKIAFTIHAPDGKRGRASTTTSKSSPPQS